jgi:outer membrane protein assembly factor BamA
VAGTTSRSSASSGWASSRFIDKDLVFGNLEYHFPVWNIELTNGAAIDGALFFDCGTVLPRLSRLQQKDLRSDAGVGLRLVTARGLFVRFDNAWSSEGYRNDLGLVGSF